MNMDRLEMLHSLLQDLIPFVQQAYFVDACLLAASYPEWLDYGRGVANYLAVPDLPLDARATKFDLPGGVITDGNLHSVRPFSTGMTKLSARLLRRMLRMPGIRERARKGLGKGKPIRTTPISSHDGKYSWVKAPRYDGKPMQVGPLSNILVGYASGHPLTRKWTDAALDRISSRAWLAGFSRAAAVHHGALCCTSHSLRDAL